jgi:anthranilate phosphoribosyltransferase
MEESSKMALKKEEMVRKCVQMMRGKSDEHKFAGLLMLTKIQNLSIVEMATVRHDIVQAVGVNFFLRLLHTQGINNNIILIIILIS